MARYILGISAYYHDSAACLLKDGAIVGAAQEERFSRKKHDPRFPVAAIRFCLERERIGVTDLEAVVFYDKPFVTFERLLETYLHFAPTGIRSFLTAMPVWLKEKLFLRKTIEKELARAFSVKPKALPVVLFSEHHESHAASAFYPSPFDEAAVLCMDGVGEWATTSAWTGRGRELSPLWELRFPHSLGLLYSAFTYYTGFKVNSGEYKVMGLAPYGKPVYTQRILEHLLDLKEDGTFRLNLDYFDYCAGLRMTNSKFDELFGGSPRKSETKLTQKEMDLASSIQFVTEEVVLRLSRKLRSDTGSRNLCLAGGVALNCVANGRLLREGPFEKVWIQPAAGDAGGAVGCALAVWHQYFAQDRKPPAIEETDGMAGAYLGPEFSFAAIEDFLKAKAIPYHVLPKQELLSTVATELSREKIVGWFQGRMEFGPRSLGARSILGDARSPKMQSTMNLKIKFRESFRPFAPAVLREKVSEYFEMDGDSPYMLLVANVRPSRRMKPEESQTTLWGLDLLHVPKSDIPAATHVDYSARIQTVHEETNPTFHGLLREFERKTGYGILINTSFNVRGEPIVCTPEDAYRCFMRTDIDVLVLENCVLYKEEQPTAEKQGKEWLKEFELD